MKARLDDVLSSFGLSPKAISQFMNAMRDQLQVETLEEVADLDYRTLLKVRNVGKKMVGALVSAALEQPELMESRLAMTWWMHGRGLEPYPRCGYGRCPD